MSQENKPVFEELRGELEAMGVPPPQAERLAHAQAKAAAATEAGETEEPAQHVVPVATGWLVIRRFAASDAEVFPSRAEAEERARAIAAESGGRVVIHDRDGVVERVL
jgi:hypothetical protein